MGTLYRKVAVSERMPPPMTDILIKYRWNNYFEPYHYFDDLHCKDEMLNEVTHWIEEIPNPTTQLQADKAELLEALVQSDSIIRNRITGADTIEEAKFILDLRKKVEDFIKSNPESKNIRNENNNP